MSHENNETLKFEMKATVEAESRAVHRSTEAHQILIRMYMAHADLVCPCLVLAPVVFSDLKEIGVIRVQSQAPR